MYLSLKINALEFLIKRAEEKVLEDDGFVEELYQKYYSCEKELAKAKNELEKAELETIKVIRYAFITFDDPNTANLLIRKYHEDRVGRLVGLDREEWR